MNPLTALPTNVRKWLYVLYATLGIAFGAVQVGYATANVDQPGWLLVAFGVFGYLGTALGLVAAANVAPLSLRGTIRAGTISTDSITGSSITGSQITVGDSGSLERDQD